MSYTLYGIPNCDTIKKAKTWLENNGIEYHFHNYKKEGIEQSKLKEWLAKESISTILNKAGTTFRKLPIEDKSRIEDQSFVIELLQAQPSMIKRPVLEKDGTVIAVGFKPDIYQELFSSK